MARGAFHRKLRRWHRYLGVIFGIQFLLWTLGGLFFSWTNIKVVRGDNIRKEAQPLFVPDSLMPMPQIIGEFRKAYPDAGLESIQLLNTVQGLAVYQIRYKQNNVEHYRIADAVKGGLLPLITQTEAEMIALKSIKIPAIVKKTELLTVADGGHEYREKPLPAYAVYLNGKGDYVVYVGQETGMVHSIRNNQWRLFDFLWMMHISDYKNRDHINNWILRVLSVLGLVTLFSGYLLFFVSRKKRKKFITE